MATKKYFSLNSHICYCLRDHILEAKDNNLESIVLIEAILDKEINKTHVFCYMYENAISKSMCNKECDGFDNTSGRSCQFKSKLYIKGDAFLFDVETSKMCKNEKCN